MLSYALSDAKIVVYIFELFIGLFNYLNSNIYNNFKVFQDKNNQNPINVNDDINDYYEEILNRIKENKVNEKEIQSAKTENLYTEKKQNSSICLKYALILLESNLKSIEIMRQRLEADYRKIDININ